MDRNYASESRMKAQRAIQPTRKTRKLPTKYFEGITWIAMNDDTEFMNDEDPAQTPCVTLCMVADLWNVPHAEAVKHLRHVLDRAAGIVPNAQPVTAADINREFAKDGVRVITSLVDNWPPKA